MSQSTYLCIPTAMTGFKFNKSTKKWYQTQFDAEGRKFTLSKSTDGEWKWRNLAYENVFTKCSNFNDSGSLFCNNIYDVVFNKKNMRYQLYYPFGYINGGLDNSKEGEDSPAIEIGKCSPIN